MVHLKPDEIIESFIKRDCFFSESLRTVMNNGGKHIDDNQMIKLIARRIEMRDCQENGWVLEGYP